MPQRDSLTSTTDVLVIYQDRYQVSKTIEHIQALNLSFKCLRMNKGNIENIVSCHAKIILLSSHHLITSTEFYLDLLVQCKNRLDNHQAIPLINGQEAQAALTACIDKLFDNFIIIEPSIENERLSLVILQSLNAIAEHKLHTSKLFPASQNSRSLEETKHEKSIQRHIGLSLKNYQRSITHQLTQHIKSPELLAVISQCFIQEKIKLSRDLNAKAATKLLSLTTEIQKATLINIANNKKITNRINYANKPLTSLASTDTSSAKSVALNSYKVLIAESSMLLANDLAETFENMNFQIRISINGKETLQAFKEFHPDLILLEDDLAHMDGISVTRKIRNLGSSVPIIILIDKEKNSSLKQWVPLGISAFLAKSTKQAKILDTVLSELLNPSDLLKFETENNIDQIQWQPEYSVGHPLMDQHHKQLFHLIRAFLSTEYNHQQTMNVFDMLQEYMVMHFKAEEALLTKHHFPDFLHHKNEHEGLMNKVRVMQEKLSFKDEEIHLKVGLFLYKWLSHHILKSDQEYKNFIHDETVLAAKSKAISGDF